MYLLKEVAILKEVIFLLTIHHKSANATQFRDVNMINGRRKTQN